MQTGHICGRPHLLRINVARRNAPDMPAAAEAPAEARFPAGGISDVRKQRSVLVIGPVLCPQLILAIAVAIIEQRNAPKGIALSLITEAAGQFHAHVVSAHIVVVGMTGLEGMQGLRSHLYVETGHVQVPTVDIEEIILL